MHLLLLSELHPAVDDLVAGTGLVGVIPDAGDAIGEPQIAETARAWLRRAGAVPVDIVVDGDVPAQLEAVEILVVTGGDPGALAQRLRRTGADEAVLAAVRGGLPYVGVSAGAMAAGPTLQTAVDVDPEELPGGDAHRGLGLTDVCVLPHLGRRGRDGLLARALARHAPERTVVGLADADGLRVRGNGAVELFGPQRGDRLRSALPGEPGVVVATRDGVLVGSVHADGVVTADAPWAAARLTAWAARTDPRSPSPRSGDTTCPN